jgi:hypothetical protein
MPSGIDRKEEATGSPPSLITDITDENELEEILRIANRLVKDEKVIFVAKQSRFKPGGSKSSPAEGFAGDIVAIDKEKAEKIMSYIEEKMNQATTTTTTSNPQSSSAADELTKIARLKEQGILSEAEFNQMKQEILKKL